MFPMLDSPEVTAQYLASTLASSPQARPSAKVHHWCVNQDRSSSSAPLGSSSVVAAAVVVVASCSASMGSVFAVLATALLVSLNAGLQATCGFFTLWVK